MGIASTLQTAFVGSFGSPAQIHNLYASRSPVNGAAADPLKPQEVGVLVDRLLTQVNQPHVAAATLTQMMKDLGHRTSDTPFSLDSLESQNRYYQSKEYILAHGSERNVMDITDQLYAEDIGRASGRVFKGTDVLAKVDMVNHLSQSDNLGSTIDHVVEDVRIALREGRPEALSATAALIAGGQLDAQQAQGLIQEARAHDPSGEFDAELLRQLQNQGVPDGTKGSLTVLAVTSVMDTTSESEISRSWQTLEYDASQGLARDIKQGLSDQESGLSEVYRVAGEIAHAYEEQGRPVPTGLAHAVSAAQSQTEGLLASQGISQPSELTGLYGKNSMDSILSSGHYNLAMAGSHAPASGRTMQEIQDAAFARNMEWVRQMQAQEPQQDANLSGPQPAGPSPNRR
ncbi:hypothetical protein [Marinobacterium sp. BA1]|uniref:hypothetical protein n=1 Tax=Marinobacterium sp. BA1 TaxID=3138931 RepID=UPI0032E6A339